MCSVFGYIGTSLGKQRILQGLARLEYRGYDSAGFACLDHATGALETVKAAGTLEQLQQKLATVTADGYVGLGHTRWSTHGVPTERNAHPHLDCTKSIALVHNGIVENYHTLRPALLEQGHNLDTDTDTELIAHLLESALQHYSIEQALQRVVAQLQGAYAFVAISSRYPDHIIAVRYRSPLCIAQGPDGLYVASDPLACAGYANNVWHLPDQTIAILVSNRIQAIDFTGIVREPHWQPLKNDWIDVSKQQHAHFMLKEIYEQKVVIQQAVRAYQAQGIDLVQHMQLSHEDIKKLAYLSLVGAGTSWHAARIGQFFFEQIAQVPTSVHLASEFRYMLFFFKYHGAHMMISRSGETADTLEALRLVREASMHTIAITDVASSSIVRESDGHMLTYAGTEVAVASTKAFTAQVVALYWLAHIMAVIRNTLPEHALHTAAEKLQTAAVLLEESLDRYKDQIQHELAPRYAAYDRFIFLGRHISYPFAMEAALKLKEISYAFVECYPAGELKHGPIALIDQRTPVFLFSHMDDLMYQKILSNAQEIKARHGHLVVFGFQGQHELQAIADLFIEFPRVAPLLGPLVMTGVMQLFAYSIANVLGRPIDKPRNLAKAVTVE